MVDFYWGRQCDLDLVLAGVSVGRKYFGETLIRHGMKGRLKQELCYTQEGWLNGK
jgi:hypothetical protein